MILDYQEILHKYHDHISVIHQLLTSDGELDKKDAVKVLKKRIIKLKNLLTKNSKIFNDSKLSLASIREFILKVVMPICRDLSKIIKFLLLKNLKEITDLLIDFSKSIHDFGCSSLSKNIFSVLIEKINDLVKLSDILDLVLECGYLDLALNILDKMKKQGLITFATTYNEALIKYLLGRDIEALEVTKKSIRKYGSRPELLGLLSAIYIGIGELDEAKKALRILRGK